MILDFYSEICYFSDERVFKRSVFFSRKAGSGGSHGGHGVFILGFLHLLRGLFYVLIGGGEERTITKSILFFVFSSRVNNLFKLKRQK